MDKIIKNAGLKTLENVENKAIKEATKKESTALKGAKRDIDALIKAVDKVDGLVAKTMFKIIKLNDVDYKEAIKYLENSKLSPSYKTKMRAALNNLRSINMDKLTPQQKEAISDEKGFVPLVEAISAYKKGTLQEDGSYPKKEIKKAKKEAVPVKVKSEAVAGNKGIEALSAKKWTQYDANEALDKMTALVNKLMQLEKYEVIVKLCEGFEDEAYKMLGFNALLEKEEAVVA
jgi:hypothetical protein